MNRRATIWALLALAAAMCALTAAAQHDGPARRIGVLAQDLQPGLLDTFRDELGKLGYVEGRNITMEVRTAEGINERLTALTSDLLRLKVDIILAVNTPAAKAAKEATKSVPIVIVRVADPVKSGLVESLARPGGNVTGLSFMPDELGSKGIEILREVLPKISRMGHLYQGDNPGNRVVVDAVEARGVQLGLKIVRLPVIEPKDYKGAFETAARARIEGLFVMDDGAITQQRRQILDLSAKYSLPVVAVYKDFATAGAVIAYGPRLSVVYRRAGLWQFYRGVQRTWKPARQPSTLLMSGDGKRSVGLWPQATAPILDSTTAEIRFGRLSGSAPAGRPDARQHRWQGLFLRPAHDMGHSQQRFFGFQPVQKIPTMRRGIYACREECHGSSRYDSERPVLCALDQHRSLRPSATGSEQSK